MAKKTTKKDDDLELSRAEFVLEGDYSDPDELEKVAWEAFYELRVSAYERYEGMDVGLKVHAEEGSAEVVALVVGAIGGVYGAIANYPDFKAGVKEMAKDAKYVAKKVLSITRVVKAKQKGKLLTLRADAGAIGQVDQLFKKVKKGKLSRAQGEELALDLLERFGTLPDDTKQAIQSSFRTMKVAGTQLRIPDEEEVQRPKRTRTPKLREPLERKSEWSVDIESRSREEKPKVSRRKT
jgi:hypothetical protein